MAFDLCPGWPFCQAKPDADSTWTQQQKESKENPLYTLLNLQQTGTLVDIYENEGSGGIETFCETELPAYLYKHPPHVIRTAEYTDWRRTNDSQVTQGDHQYVQKSCSYVGPIKENFKDHEACWDLFLRGGVGETLLHLCFLNNTPIHTEISKTLLTFYPKMALDIYEADEYYGETALHFAIVHGNLDSVNLLVEARADVNQRATGLFFLPEDARRLKLSPSEYQGDYDGYAYYGEYPLAFASCCGFESIYDHLIKHGADPNRQDSFGNTVLHMAVIKNQPEMYSYAIRHHIKKADPSIKNYYGGQSHGLTPLALASKLGRREMVDKIMELERRELWTFSNVQCSQYPMFEVDSITAEGETCGTSALLLTVDGESDDHMELCQYGVIRQLIESKWRYYIRGNFFWRLAMVVLQLAVQFVAVALRTKSDLTELRHPDLSQTTSLNEYAMAVARFVMEILMLLFSILAFGLHGHEMYNLGVRWFFTNLRRTPYRALYLIGCFLILLCLPIRLASIGEKDGGVRAQLRMAEESLLIVAIPFTWCKLLFFAKVHAYVGPLINMLVLVFLTDLRPIFIIEGVFFISFGSAFFVLFRTIVDTTETFATPYGSVMSLFHFMFGEFEYDEFSVTEYPALTMIVFVFFMIFVPILMLNMLIARMTNTFHKVFRKAEKEAIQQWSRIVIVLERSIPPSKLKEYRKLYAINMNLNQGNEDGVTVEKNRDQMIASAGAMQMVRTTSKTKPKQRRDAIRQWKFALKKTLELIKTLKGQASHVQTVEVSYQSVFPYAEDIYMDRSPRHRTSSFQLTNAVEQLVWEKT